VAEQQEIDWATVREKAGPFAPEAFAFIREGLAHTVRTIHGDVETQTEHEETRHVSGQQLCLGLRDYAIRKYGMLARTVLARWGVHATDDFGRIVFAMIETGLLRKSERDTISDFRSVYDFSEAFTVGVDL
jgi:uncharacterized repeat protein (TIGR04138 family)